jgi:c-di-GMP-binding flagellar brake protein YcgR
MEGNREERRRHIRFDSLIPMRYRKIETDTQEYKGSLMRDISEGGARMTIYEFLPRNLKLATEIPLISGTKPLKGTCRVAWAVKAAFSEQYDVGVEFVNFNQEDRTQVAKYIFDRNAAKIL